MNMSIRRVTIMKLNNEEAAAYLSVSKNTLANWRSAQSGPKYYKPTEKLVYYFKEDLDAWIKSRERENENT